jgi:hypothetical protein
MKAVKNIYLGVYLFYLMTICVVRFISEAFTKYVILSWTIYQTITEILQLRKTILMTGKPCKYFVDVWNAFDMMRIISSIGYLVCAFTPGNT